MTNKETLIPSTISNNGKDPITGKFLPNNKLSKGNPHVNKVAALKAAIMGSATDKDVMDVMAMLKEEAIVNKNIHAAKEYLSRLVGQPTAQIEAIVNDGVSAEEKIKMFKEALHLKSELGV